MDLESGLALEREIWSILARKFLFIIIVFFWNVPSSIWHLETLIYMVPCSLNFYISLGCTGSLLFTTIFYLPQALMWTPCVLHNGCRTSELDSFWVTDIPRLTLVISFMLGQKKRFVQHETEKTKGYIFPLIFVIISNWRQTSLS